MKCLAVFLGLMVGAGPLARAQSGDSVAISAAPVAAGSWLAMVDHARYGESWDSASALFRHAVTKTAWVAAVGAARRPFEPFGKRQRLAATFQTTLPKAPPGQYVVLQFRTKTGDGTNVIETVTPMKDVDGRWRVSGYYIRPE